MHHLLSKTLQQTEGIVHEHMSERNAIRRMVTAGSRAASSLSQICAALGQQSLEGKRIMPEKGTRTLPCFAHDDVSLAGRGMVYNSFALGLSPPGSSTTPSVGAKASSTLPSRRRSGVLQHA